MGTKAQTLVMTLVYAGLAISLTGLLSTALIDNFPHQIFGIAFFVLLVCHLLLNRFWIRHSLMGMWDFRRIFLTTIDAILAVLSAIQVINCVLLSNWSLLPQSIAYFSSSLHMCIGTWIFVIAAVHFGLNINALIGNELHLERIGNNKIRRTRKTLLTLLIWLLLAIVGVYGIFEFFQLHMLDYMLFLDGVTTQADAPLLRFIQYLCVGIALTEITHCLSIFSQRCPRRRLARTKH